MTATPDWLPSVQTQSTVDGWKRLLLRGRGGGTLGNVANALIALRNAPDWRDVLHFNESALAVIAKAEPPFERVTSVPFQWNDEHDIQTAAWLQHQGVSVSKEI